MPNKLDLLKITKLVKKKKKMTNLITFIRETIDVSDIQDFYLSFEMTLFVYNVIINGDKHMCTYTMKQHVLHILQTLYMDKGDFSDSAVQKINDDIRHIEDHRLYTLISNAYLYAYTAYFFFVQSAAHG